MQGLVGQLRSQLGESRQETSIATEALTASNELAGRLQAHAEVAREQGAAAVQRVAHEHARVVADLEHRFQQATAALQRTTAAAAAADAEQQHSTQTLQQELDAALAESSASSSRNAELADTVEQLQMALDAAQSSMAAEHAASEEAISQLQAQLVTLQHQLAAAAIAAAAAGNTSAGRCPTSVADHHSDLEQPAAEQGRLVLDLEQRLELAQGELQRLSAEAATKEEDSRKTIQAVQQQLAHADFQVLLTQGQVFDSAGVIARLEEHLESAQQAEQRQADASSSAVQEWQKQVRGHSCCKL